MEAQVKTNSHGIAKDVGDLVDTYISLAKVNATQKAATAASGTLAYPAMAVFASFVILFMGFGLAWWIGQLLSSMVAGFFIVAVFFALLLILLVAFKEQLVYPIVRNKIVKKVYE